MTRAHLLTFAALPFAVFASASSAQVFTSTVDIDGTVQDFGFNTAEEALTFFDPDTLDSQFSNYVQNTNTNNVDGRLNYRGLQMRIDMVSGSADVRLRIESIGVDETFSSGITREDNASELFDFLTTDGGRLLSQIQSELARVSPVDPVAGNPNSMQTKMLDTSFSSGAFNTGVSFVPPSGTGSDGDNQKAVYRNAPAGTSNSFDVTASGGAFSAGGASGTALTLPVGYVARIDAVPGLRVNLSVPVTYSETEGSVTVGAIGGLGVAVPISDVWSVTPGVTYGLVGSVDLGAVAQLVGASVTSAYTIRHDRGNLTIGNMLGYVTTLPFKSGDFNYDPGIDNVALKNGVSAEVPTNIEMFGLTTSYQLTYAYTYLFGSDLYMNDYHDVAASWGVSEGERGFASVVRLGVGATFGRDYSSYGLNFGYSF